MNEKECEKEKEYEIEENKIVDAITVVNRSPVAKAILETLYQESGKVSLEALREKVVDGGRALDYSFFKELLALEEMKLIYRETTSPPKFLATPEAILCLRADKVIRKTLLSPLLKALCEDKTADESKLKKELENNYLRALESLKN